MKFCHDKINFVKLEYRMPVMHVYKAVSRVKTQTIQLKVGGATMHTQI